MKTNITQTFTPHEGSVCVSCLVTSYLTRYIPHSVTWF